MSISNMLHDLTKDMKLPVKNESCESDQRNPQISGIKHVVKQSMKYAQNFLLDQNNVCHCIKIALVTTFIIIQGDDVHKGIKTG